MVGLNFLKMKTVIYIYIYNIFKRRKTVRKAMPDNCWYKLILTKNDFMPDVSTVEQPSSAAYEQLHIWISNYKHYTQISH